MSIRKENTKKQGETIKYPSDRNQNNDLTFNDIQFRYSQKKVYGYFGEYSIANKIFTQLSSSKNVHGPILLFYIFTTPFIFCQFSTFIHWVILHQVHQNWKLLQETMNSSRIDWFEGHWCGSTNHWVLSPILIKNNASGKSFHNSILGFKWNLQLPI